MGRSNPVRLCDENGPEIVDVGVRRAGDHQIFQALEEPIGVVPVQVCLNRHARLFGAGRGVGCDERPSIVLDAVNAVGIGRECPDARFSF